MTICTDGCHELSGGAPRRDRRGRRRHAAGRLDRRDLRERPKRGEAVALPIALVIMLVVFGGFIAAGIPLIGAGVSIAGALGALLGFTFLLDIDTTVVNVVTAVGLGLSIDYGLLIVSRFREEHRRAGVRRSRGPARRDPPRSRHAGAPCCSRGSRSRSRRSACWCSSRASCGRSGWVRSP